MNGDCTSKVYGRIFKWPIQSHPLHGEGGSGVARSLSVGGPLRGTAEGGQGTRRYGGGKKILKYDQLQGHSEAI